ncbi:hypothetical protein [Pseudaminobacter sp. NGMCC 1.201702]|uniref:hypothetical protein n=1 Tax=Pseudaminobacter sp. NGMCC 1.201702 TaxID=3391825 RepID=UPI0039F0BBCE
MNFLRWIGISSEPSARRSVPAKIGNLPQPSEFGGLRLIREAQPGLNVTNRQIRSTKALSLDEIGGLRFVWRKELSTIAVVASTASNNLCEVLCPIFLTIRTALQA